MGLALVLGANALWLAAVANITLGTFAVGALAVGAMTWAIVLPSLPKFVNVIIVVTQVAFLAATSVAMIDSNYRKALTAVQASALENMADALID